MAESDIQVENSAVKAVKKLAKKISGLKVSPAKSAAPKVAKPKPQYKKDIPFPEPPRFLGFVEIEELLKDERQYHFVEISNQANIIGTPGMVPSTLSVLQKKVKNSKKNALESQAVSCYIGCGSSVINRALRHNIADLKAESYNGQANYCHYVHAMDALLSRCFVQEPITVYRGFGGATDHLKKLKVGDIVRDEGFMSTSLNPQTSTGFSGHDGHICLIARIDVPEGSNGYYVGAGEYELILPRDQKLLLIDIYGQTAGMKYRIYHFKSASGRPFVSPTPPPGILDE